MTVVPGKKVFVGMSGGVDSSVSAALLKREGYEVTGVFIKAWHPDFLPCSWKDDRRDAMRVCASLDIPFMTFDLEKEYKRDVVDYMIREYGEGRTPNPDVMCNKSIKFGAFLNRALELGADFVATGHYAQVVETTHGDTIQYKLLESRDTQKDQTYFIWNLNQKQLKHVLFPVGEFEKSHVRALAKQFNLPTFAKKDSQGLCFMGKVDIKDFLENYFKSEKGEVRDEQGAVIGEHDGAWFYTIGERHGFKIVNESPTETPYYIVDKDVKRNILTVSHREPTTELLKPIQSLSLSDINWVRKIPTPTTPIDARIRYRQTPVACRVIAEDTTATVYFEEPQSIVSLGQSMVFYKEGECLGGGIIHAILEE